MKKVKLLYCFALNILLVLNAVAQNNKVLAEKILADKKLDSVYNMSLALLAKGFNAGDGYPQVWIRDMNTFIEASCKVYNQGIIRKNLITFFDLQQPNGEIVDGYVLKGHVTWDDANIYYSTSDTTHVGFKNTVETDQETSLIQAVAKYIKVTGDSTILTEEVAGQTLYARMQKAIDYLLKNRYSEKHKLLTGATTQDWGDMQIEGGATVDVDENTHWAMDVYDNAMFIIALRNMIGFATTTQQKQHWQQLKETTAASVKKYLWDNANNKFIPHLYINDSPFPKSFNENAMYFHGGTAVAIEAGLLSKKEVAIVNKAMLHNVQLSGAPSIGLTIYPPYPEDIYKNSTANKPYFYQNGGDWTWFGARMIQQLIAYNYVTEAYTELQPMVDLIIKYNSFYEWYHVDGKPAGSNAFKGSAGVMVTAIDMLKAWAGKNL